MAINAAISIAWDVAQHTWVSDNWQNTQYKRWVQTETMMVNEKRLVYLTYPVIKGWAKNWTITATAKSVVTYDVDVNFLFMTISLKCLFCHLYCQHRTNFSSHHMHILTLHCF
jgi:hypothetical protein